MIVNGFKYCSKCQQDKPVDDFSIDNSRKDGLQPYCKDCHVQFRKEHKNELSAYHKQYQIDNKVEYDIYQKQYRQEHKEKNKEISKTEERKKTFKKSRKKRVRLNKISRYIREKRKKDPNFRIANNLRSRIRKILKTKNVKRSISSVKLLGCGIEEFKQYIESLFLPGMTWDNYGKVWDLDHYIPLSYFDLTQEENQYISCHFLNIRPLWSYENQFIKSDNLPEDYLDHIEYIKHWLNEQNKKVA